MPTTTCWCTRGSGRSTSGARGGRFTDPRGGEHFEGGWEPPEVGEEPVEALLEENRRNGADPDGFTAGARWKRMDDIPDDVLFRALEAMA